MQALIGVSKMANLTRWRSTSTDLKRKQEGGPRPGFISFRSSINGPRHWSVSKISWIHMTCTGLCSSVLNSPPNEAPTYTFDSTWFFVYKYQHDSSSHWFLSFLGYRHRRHCFPTSPLFEDFQMLLPKLLFFCYPCCLFNYIHI